MNIDEFQKDDFKKLKLLSKLSIPNKNIIDNIKLIIKTEDIQVFKNLTLFSCFDRNLIIEISMPNNERFDIIPAADMTATAKPNEAVGYNLATIIQKKNPIAEVIKLLAIKL